MLTNINNGQVKISAINNA